MTHDPLADFDAEILRFLASAGVDPGLVPGFDTPPRREFGERATSVAMRLAREQKRAPREIAQQVVDSFNPSLYRFIASVDTAGAGFINFHLNYEAFIPHLVRSIRESGSFYGRRSDHVPERVVVEHTSVNPNKEWHIGHVRNAVLGDVVTHLLRLMGDDVQVQNYIDDTGMQAAQAIVGLRDFPEPERPDEKYDHFSGRLYVKIASELAAERDLKKRLDQLEAKEGLSEGERAECTSVRSRLENIKRLQQNVLQTMQQLERAEHRGATEKILNAQLATAFCLGIYYDLLNWESDLVASGAFDQAMELIEASSHVYRPADGRYAGALVIETGSETAPGDDIKAEVLIRSSGLPTYVAKDIAYHVWKFQLVPDKLRYAEYAPQPNGRALWSTDLGGNPHSWPTPQRIINVIAVNQSPAQEAVKQALRVAGFPQAADSLVHLAYGLVSTAEGKLSGRKGTSVSGDAVIQEAVRVADERVREKRSAELTEEEIGHIAEAVGVGAVRYFMSQYNPMREIVFDVRDVVSYDGNTALYIQYALVRMFAILRKALEERGIGDEVIDAADPAILQHEQERRLAFQLAQFPGVVADASRLLAVNLVAEFAYELATTFSQFYRDCIVLDADPSLRDARLLLVRTVRDVLRQACDLLGVPVIERL